MKKTLMAATVALGAAGFYMPTQASAAVFSPGAASTTVDVSKSLTTEVQHRRHRRGYRPQGYARWHGHHLSHRRWSRRPHYGRIIGGIAIGSLLAGSAYYAYAGAPPAPGLCWYWADPYETRGYWDYC
jgi:hypothetical protein